jgi:hypothetical protein
MKQLEPLLFETPETRMAAPRFARKPASDIMTKILSGGDENEA